MNKQLGVVSINSAYELSDVFIDARLSQYGSKGIYSKKVNRVNLSHN